MRTIDEYTKSIQDLERYLDEVHINREKAVASNDRAEIERLDGSIRETNSRIATLYRKREKITPEPQHEPIIRPPETNASEVNETLSADAFRQAEQMLNITNTHSGRIKRIVIAYMIVVALLICWIFIQAHLVTVLNCLPEWSIPITIVASPVLLFAIYPIVLVIESIFCRSKRR
jgi:hypothetical protein